MSIVDTFQDEQPAKNLLNLIPEVATTENIISKIIEKLRFFANIPLPTQYTSSISARQIPMFVEQKINDFQQDIVILKPKNLLGVKIKRSEYGPLIFWALVYLSKKGELPARGVEITKVINDYLVDDFHEVWPNNVSRALRNKTLQSQKWLKTKKINPRLKLYGLAKGWEKYWLEVFGEP
ncbi:MAG TPA: hypothetical protein VI451_15825, partial [Anaerolineales bacterium]|nr:hypothetical protein [Anaerolineales bacterium]